jgi:hypothetical protein
MGQVLGGLSALTRAVAAGQAVIPALSELCHRSLARRLQRLGCPSVFASGNANYPASTGDFHVNKISIVAITEAGGG